MGFEITIGNVYELKYWNSWLTVTWVKSRFIFSTKVRNEEVDGSWDWFSDLVITVLASLQSCCFPYGDKMTATTLGIKSALKADIF